MSYLGRRLLRVVVAVVFFAVITGIMLIIELYKKKKNDKIVAAFLSQHPAPARVFLTMEKTAPQGVDVHAVNGTAAPMFYEGDKTGFYLAPGQHMVQVNYWWRQDKNGRVVKKNAPKTDVMLQAQANGIYRLAFDTNQNMFTFQEMA